jgi:adenylate cyclase
VHVHAAVCNSLLTGFQRIPGPLAGQLLIVLSLGLVGTWIGVRSTVVGGPLLVIVALVLWGVFASVVLWGMYDRIWSIAGPTVAASAGWLVVVLHRLLVEQRSRRKTEERFKSYVSPAVVDILVQNPSLSSMAPQQKELTVLFTDIAGFTTTAEKLGSQGTAELLAIYLGTMTEVVQRHGATLDKYIGDAIMAFWGAPIDDLKHARNACTAAVEMMKTLDRLNEENAFGAAGVLKVRIGLATGELMVGDFGNPPRNSSYTVIGDTANLSSRLEGANKVFGAPSES